MADIIKTPAYIESFLRHLLPAAGIEFRQIDHFHWKVFLENKGKEVVFVFDRDKIDDFEEAIQKYDGTNYFYSLQSDILFHIYIALGKAGMINDFDIVSALIEERRDWVEVQGINVARDTFSSRITEMIYKGLQRLNDYLKDVVQKFGDGHEEIKKDIEDINHLLSYHDEKKSFISTGVSVRSLSLFKAALISEIIDEVKQKYVEGIPQRMIDKVEHDIYMLVEELRKPTFLNIKLPMCIAEYRSQIMPKQKIAEEGVLQESNTLNVFISYSTKNKAVAGKVKDILNNYGITGFLAHEDINITEEWKKRIIFELRQTNVFIAILSQDFKASDWTAQEAGMAYFKNILIIPLLLDDTTPFGFLEDSQGKKISYDLTPEEYIIKPIVDRFSNLLIDKIIDKLEQVNNFRTAERVLGFIVPYFEKLNATQINNLVNVSIRNGQICFAHLCQTEYLPQLLRMHKSKISQEKYDVLLFQIEKGELHPDRLEKTKKEPWLKYDKPWLKR